MTPHGREIMALHRGEGGNAEFPRKPNREGDTMTRAQLYMLLAVLFVCSTSGQAVTIAVNLGNAVGTGAYDDRAAGGYYWTTDGLTGNNDLTTVTSLKDVTGAATDFVVQLSDGIRLTSTVISASPFTLDGVRLPSQVVLRGYGGIERSWYDALWAMDIRVPVASGLNDWSFQLFGGDGRNGALSPMAANIGGTFTYDAGTTVGTFTGGVTTTFDGPATDPNGLGVPGWYRSGQLSNITPSVQNIGGVDYYVVTLQFADMGRHEPGTEDYSNLSAFVLTAVASGQPGEIPEPSVLALTAGGFGMAFARRRRHGRSQRAAPRGR